MLRLPRNRLPKSNKHLPCPVSTKALRSKERRAFVFMMMFAEDYFSMGCEGFQSL